MAIIEQKRLILTEVGENCNKFWEIELHDNDDCITRWARVGYSPQSKTFPGVGHSFMEKKMREKNAKGYTELKTISTNNTGSASGVTVKKSDLHAIAKAQIIKSSNPTLERLIARFVQANVHKITSNTQITYNSTTGLFATPMGIVEQSGIDEARTLLAELAIRVRNHKFGGETDILLNRYLRVIPQSLGMKRFSTETVIPDDNALQKQLDLLDSLESSYQALQSTPVPMINESTKPIEQMFKVDLDVLSNQAERTRLERNFEMSKKRMHGYNNIHVKEVYSLNIHHMSNNFLVADKNIVETYHGSSMANALSILREGLKIIPPSTAAIAGALFGRGLYGSINSSKSLGYCLNRWGQGGIGDAASSFLFVCSFAMGETYSTTAYGCARPSGYDSIWAKASPGGLHNDELIVYSENQAKVNYLLECK